VRNGALDYQVFFVDALNNVVPGQLETVFDFGWTTATTADNYLGRWVSPVDATGMFIYANTIDGTFDGNAQIDAVIVAKVPEPGRVLGAAIFGSLLWVRRSRRDP
jgi:hypothetical protein